MPAGVDETLEGGRQVDREVVGAAGRDLARDGRHADRPDAIRPDGAREAASQADHAADRPRHIDHATEIIGDGGVVRMAGRGADGAVDHE